MPKYRFSEIAINITEKRMPVPEDKEFYIAPNNLDTETLTVPEFGYKVDLNGTKLVMRKGDMLFGRREPQLKHAAIAPHDGLFSAHGMIFHPREEVITKDFFPFFISSDYFFDAAIRISVGSLSPTVNWKDLKDLEFYIPDLAEQERYAKILWGIIESKKAYKQLISATDDLVKSQFIEMFDDPVNGLNTMPLGNIAKLERGRFSPRPRNDPRYYDGPYPFIQTGEIANCEHRLCQYRQTLNEEGIRVSKQFGVGTIVIAIVGATIGATAILEIPVYAPDSIIGIIPNNEYCPEYVEMALRFWQPELLRTAPSVARANINLDILAGVRIPKASRHSQNMFVQLMQQSDKSKFEAQQAYQSLNAMQKALIKSIFTE